MIRKYAFAAAAVVLGATPSLAAEFYIVQDSATKRCQIVEQRPTTSTTVVVGDGRVYTSRTEADTALRSVEVCRSGTTGIGGSSTTTTSPK